MTTARRTATFLASLVLASTAVLTGATAAQAATPQETMQAGLEGVASDLNALIASGALEQGDAQAAVEAVFANHGFAAREVKTIDEAVASGGGLWVGRRSLEVVALFDDAQTVCVGEIVTNGNTWSYSGTMCTDRQTALAGSGAAALLTAADTLIRNATAIAMTDTYPSEKVAPSHVWQSAHELGFADGKQPKKWNRGHGYSRGASGAIEALSTKRFMLSTGMRLATGETASCTLTLTLRKGTLTRAMPACTLTSPRD